MVPKGIIQMTPFSLKIEHHSELTQDVMCQIAHLHSTLFQIIDNLADDKKIYLQQGGNHFFQAKWF